MNDLIDGLLARKKTGRGNIDVGQVEAAKRLLRQRHPQGVRVSEIAVAAGCSQARAARLLDLLSGHCADNGNSVTDFLVWEDDFARPPLFYIAKDSEGRG